MRTRGKSSCRATVLGLMACGVAFLAGGRSAEADFLFSPTGTGAGDAQVASVIDPGPGNALAQGGVTAINNFLAGGPAAGNTFQLYYQAVVSAVFAPNNTAITTGTYAGLNNTYQITTVASVTEVVTGVSVIGGQTVATFAVSGAQSANSYVKFFESPGVTNNSLAGTGFNVGTLIYQASPVVDVNGSGLFATTNGATELYDQHGADNYSGMQSVVGNGSSTIDFATTFVNTNYFVTPPPVLSMKFTTQSEAPFFSVDPSRVFTGLGPGSTDVLPSLGAINGRSGPDFQFMADASVTPVPEPSSIALAGVGLAIALATRLRRPRR